MRLVKDNLIRFVPDAFKQSTRHRFILYGRYNYLTRKPSCGAGIIKDLCDYKEATITTVLKINFDHVF